MPEENDPKPRCNHVKVPRPGSGETGGQCVLDYGHEGPHEWPKPAKAA